MSPAAHPRAWGRGAVALLALLLVLALLPAAAGAHAGLVRSEPAAGTTLGASPTSVRLTFSETPQASLSSVTVTGQDGVARQAGPAGTVPGEPLTLAVPVQRLATGVYTVQYRVVSAVDGHAGAGAFAFGVRRSPSGATVAAPTTSASTSTLELVARCVLLVGLALLLGAAAAAVGRFGGRGDSTLRLAGAGWLIALVGVVLLTIAQRRTADATLGDLLRTPVGDALVQRAVVLLVTGSSLLVAWRRPSVRRPALGVAGVGALAAVAVHVAAGHAAAGTWSTALTVAVQVVHVAAAGLWFGGLVALLLGVRGAPSADRAQAVHRFSSLALLAVLALLLTGTVRSIDELSSVSELWDSGYGRAILAKIVLLAGIAVLGWRHRRRSVPVAGTDLQPLRRIARADLVLGLGALLAAAILGTLSPPVAAPAAVVSGIDVSGADFATTVRARLTAPSADPGPNRFTVTLKDYDSDSPVRARGVTLRFAPLDDPDTTPSSLALRPTATAGVFAGSGPNLSLDGRWGVTVQADGPQGQVTVPLEVAVRGPQQRVSALRIPGRAPQYTVQVPSVAQVQLTPHPEREGRSVLVIRFFDPFSNPLAVPLPVVTVAHPGQPTRALAVRPHGTAAFVAVADFAAGPATVAVTTRSPEGSRVRGVFDLQIPAG